jgi:DNA-binding NarL/FixJ family response regulator
MCFIGPDPGGEMNPVSVLLVDDSPIFLRIATQFLQQYGDVVVLGVADGGKECLLQAKRLQPQVVLLDLSMPDLPGLEVIPRLRAVQPQVGIIILTMLDTNGYRQAALAAGADDFISKANMADDLLPAIQRVAQASRPAAGKEGKWSQERSQQCEQRGH